MPYLGKGSAVLEAGHSPGAPIADEAVGYLVYTTTSTEDDALRLGRRLVTEHLAACANVLSGMISIYPWRGRIHEDTEALLLLKTTGTRLPALRSRLRELHPYEVPMINVVKVDQGLGEYWDWVRAWVESEPTPPAPNQRWPRET